MPGSGTRFASIRLPMASEPTSISARAPTSAFDIRSQNARHCARA